MASRGRRMLEALNIKPPSSKSSTAQPVRQQPPRRPLDLDDNSSVSSFNSFELSVLNPEWVKKMHLGKKRKKADIPTLAQYFSSSSVNSPVPLVHTPVKGSDAAKKVKTWLFKSSDKLDDSKTMTELNETTSKPGSNETREFLCPVLSKEFDENRNDIACDFPTPTSDKVTCKAAHNKTATVLSRRLIQDVRETKKDAAIPTTNQVASEKTHSETVEDPSLRKVDDVHESGKDVVAVASGVITPTTDEFPFEIVLSETSEVFSPVRFNSVDENGEDVASHFLTPTDHVPSEIDLQVSKQMRDRDEITPKTFVGPTTKNSKCCPGQEHLSSVIVSEERSCETTEKDRAEQNENIVSIGASLNKGSENEKSLLTAKAVKRALFAEKSISNGQSDENMEIDTNTEELANFLETESPLLLNDQGNQDMMLQDIFDSGIINDEDNEVLVLPLNEPVEEAIVLSIETQKRTRKNNPVDVPLTKKRRSNPSKWNAAEAKRAHNLGLPHVSLRGKHVKAKEIRVGCSNSCRQNCRGRISLEARKKHNKTYWGLGDKVLQWLHVARLVHVKRIHDGKRKKKLGEGDVPYRINSYVYHLLDEENEPVQVCQTMFLDTLTISTSVVKNALKKNSPDKRGKHTMNRRKMSTSLLDSVKNHIKSFPMVESHYCRANTSRRYLDEHLSVAKMHRLYLMVHHEGNPETAKLRQYRDIFNTFFNLGFFKPKKDQCFTCISWNSLTEEEKQTDKEQAEKYQLHIQSKITARNMKKEDKTKSRLPGSKTRVVCYDLQKVCFLPKTEIGDLFYKSKLAVYNFTMFDMSKKEAKCYVWDQTIAGRGADEMSSYVYNFIGRTASDGITEMIFWSDSCTAQNKNQYLYTMYYLASMKFKIRIIHRYLEKGHTQMEADSVHARIERRIKNENIFTPAQWYGHIGSAKVKKPQYEVVRVTQDLVVSFRDFSENAFNWKKVPISKLKEIVIDSSKPGNILYKCHWNEEEIECVVLKSKPGRPINFSTLKLKPAYAGPIPLKANLKKHLQWMLDKGYIPNSHVTNFQSILVPGEAPHEEDDEDEPGELIPYEIQMDQLYVHPQNENVDDDLNGITTNDDVCSASDISDDSDSD